MMSFAAVHSSNNHISVSHLSVVKIDCCNNTDNADGLLQPIPIIGEAGMIVKTQI